MGEVVTLPTMRLERMNTVHRYGIAAGLDVVLLTSADVRTIAPLRLCLLAPSPVGLEDLAVFPNTDDGRAEADIVAGLVLRALQVTEIDFYPGGAA